jgi:ubiquitin carboxyl-terminal hydrolase 16
VYKITAEDAEGLEKNVDNKLSRLEGLRAGIVTQALKDILDKLNERPIYKKTISAQEFIVALEYAFHTRISRQQQDAQEFLQVVTERLCDEYHAGLTARKRAKARSLSGVASFPKGERLADREIEGDSAVSISPPTTTIEDRASEDGVEEELITEKPESSLILPSFNEAITADESTDDDSREEEGFPFEGKMESHIECSHCHFKPKPSVSTFVTLTLNVPQKNSTTLNYCFDGMLKVETIDDFKCDRCRLDHALEFKKKLLKSEIKPDTKAQVESDIEKIQQALDNDPETPPEGVKLPDLKLAPARRIHRHMRISSFPKILGIHLSRSMYSAASLSQKNMAKVAFPETLPLGGLLDQRKYRLLGVVTHKGGHNSGHYETFRRQVTSVPFSTPHSFGAEGVYSQSQSGSPMPSAVQSPRLSAQISEDKRVSKGSKRLSGLSSKLSPQSEVEGGSSVLSTPALMSPSETSLSSRSSFSISGSMRRRSRPPTSAPKEELQNASPTDTNTSSPGVRLSTASSRIIPAALSEKARAKRKQKKKDNLWWRVSDDRVKESKTSEVLGMQKEVYLLFYEMIRSEEEDE